MGGRKGRDGVFPASDCIKITGRYGKYYSFLLYSHKATYAMHRNRKHLLKENND
jgi:hypothetical protein